MRAGARGPERLRAVAVSVAFGSASPVPLGEGMPWQKGERARWLFGCELGANQMSLHPLPNPGNMLWLLV